MQAFWRKGYEATSIQDLVEQMGINRFSLYDTFGDKHRLYLAALDRYRQKVASESLACLEHSHKGLTAIRSVDISWRCLIQRQLRRGKRVV